MFIYLSFLGGRREGSSVLETNGKDVAMYSTIAFFILITIILGVPL